MVYVGLRAVFRRHFNPTQGEADGFAFDNALLIFGLALHLRFSGHTTRAATGIPSFLNIPPYCMDTRAPCETSLPAASNFAIGGTCAFHRIDRTLSVDVRGLSGAAIG